MRKLLVYLICGTICALLLPNANVDVATASELVYTPINPSFGGNPLNGQWLLSSAQAQNRFKEEIEEWGKIKADTLEGLIYRQILYRIARDVVNASFGEDGLDPAYFQLGDFTIDITTDGEFITIIVTDIVTGDTTIIKIPYYGSTL